MVESLEVSVTTKLVRIVKPECVCAATYKQIKTTAMNVYESVLHSQPPNLDAMCRNVGLAQSIL